MLQEKKCLKLSLTVVKHREILLLVISEPRHSREMGCRKKGRMGEPVSQFEACDNSFLRLVNIPERGCEREVKNLILVLFPEREKIS